MTDIWYRRFDIILITDPEELDAEQQELLTWLLAFDDVILGVRRRTRPRIWCEHALNTQWQIRQTGLWPLDDDDAPDEIQSWVQAQDPGTFNTFQLAWWRFLRGLAQCNDRSPTTVHGRGDGHSRPPVRTDEICRG